MLHFVTQFHWGVAPHPWESFEARKAGISLAHIARNREIEPGKVEHPVWKQVNTWPKWMLDKYYANSLAKKTNESLGQPTIKV